MKRIPRWARKPLTDGDRGRVGAPRPEYFLRSCPKHGYVPHEMGFAPRFDRCIPCAQLHLTAVNELREIPRVA